MGLKISGKTKLFGVIGNPIIHSLSPVFQNQFLKLARQDALYLPLKISPANLLSTLPLLKENFIGFNVTIPHKEKIMEYLDEIDSLAQEYGAVNVVKNSEGRLIGYNTDGLGFLRSLEDGGISLKGKRTLILGAGGASRAIAAEIIKEGGQLTIANRNLLQGETMQRELNKKYQAFVNLIKLEELTAGYQLVINATPVGMYPEINASPIAKEFLQGTELVYDLIYNPFLTKFLKWGQEQGAKGINGLPMLVYQGAEAFKIWTGNPLTEAEIQHVYQDLKNYLEQGVNR